MRTRVQRIWLLALLVGASCSEAHAESLDRMPLRLFEFAVTPRGIEPGDVGLAWTDRWNFIAVYDPEIYFRWPDGAFRWQNAVNIDRITAADPSELIAYAGYGAGLNFDIDRTGWGVGTNLHATSRFLWALVNTDAGIKVLSWFGFDGRYEDSEVQLFGSFFDLAVTYGMSLAPPHEQSLAVGIRL